MSITVQIPTALRRHTAGVGSLNCAAANLGELFSVLDEKFPELKPAAETCAAPETTVRGFGSNPGASVMSKGPATLLDVLALPCSSTESISLKEFGR